MGNLLLQSGYLISCSYYWGLPWWLSGKESACNAGDLCLIPGWKDPLEKEMATHSSILAWEIPWTEEPELHEVAKSRTQLSDEHLPFTWHFVVTK